MQGRDWVPHRGRRVLVRPQSSGEEKSTTDQKEGGPAGRRRGWEAWLVSEDSSD